MTENPQDPAAHSDQPPPQPYAAPPPPPPDRAPEPPPSPGQAPAYGEPTPAQAPVSPSNARMWSLLAHLGGIPFSFVAPLVIFLIYKDRDAFIRRHSAQALSFQLIMLIFYIISNWLGAIGNLIGFATLVSVVVFSIIAAIAANKGEEYTYPVIPKMVT